MGLQIGDIVPRHAITFKDLAGKIVAVDAFNAIYQFLSSIRQPDGTPLMDSHGRVTSHLSGLLYRNLALMNEGVKLAYVFDGAYHELKGKTHQLRAAAKDVMQQKYAAAKDEEDIEAMGRYSRGFMRLDSAMIAESKALLEAMGVCVVQAPGEGEMQAAELVRTGEAYAVASQDYDALVVGGTRLIQNLTLARKRKVASGDFVYIAPELIEYDRVLNELGVTGDQLICLAILVGTDFNPGGVKGIGPKKALDLVKKFTHPVAIFQEVEGRMDFDWQAIFAIFHKPNVERVKVSFPPLNERFIMQLLVQEHEFSEERVQKQLDKLKELKKEAGQKKLF